MKGMMMIGGYEDHPSFTMYGVRVPDAPEDEFEATVKLKITRQDTPVMGKPCVEFTVLDLKSDAIEIEEAEMPKGDSGDALGKDMEEMVMKKRESYHEGEDS